MDQKEMLFDMYCNKMMSTAEIGRKMDRSPSHIRNLMQLYGIKIRTRNQALKLVRQKNFNCRSVRKGLY